MKAPGAIRHRYEDTFLLVLTLIIGAVVGLVVVAFILLTENLGARAYPAGGASWRRVLIPVLGALGTGFLLFRYFPNARGSGIPQTKVALFLQDGFISFRTVAGKFGLCSVSLASGVALGREGPSVQVGAGIASCLGRRLGLSSASVRSLLPAGASAAIAAAFNTPISAVLFAMEEVLGDLHAPVLGSIVLSSATSWIVLHLVLGDEPLFHVPAYQLVHPVEFVWYAALGVAGALVSTAFVKLLLWQRRHFLRAPKSTQWFLPAVGGLTVGLLGWFFPEVLGVGYAHVGNALNGQMAVSSMALLVLLKVVATSTCYASGNAGGIFGPSLFIGAMMGGAVGGFAHTLMPDYTGSVGAYALVGMGAAFAGIVRVPLTSVIMVFEITRDYSIVVPLMISNLISYFLASRFQEEPIYEALQHQEGVRLPSEARARKRLLTVAHAYRPEVQTIVASERVAQAWASVDRETGAWPVVDEAGFRGMISVERLEEAVRAGQGDVTIERLVPDPGPSVNLIETSFPHVFPDDPLEYAMHRLADGKLKALPVVSRADMRELKGTISLPDVLGAYAVGTGTGEPAPEGSHPARLPRTLMLGILGGLLALTLLAGLLNYFYRAERANKAERYYREANELVQKGQLQESIQLYRNALSISHSVDHRLGLALALIKAERMDEAALYLSQVLRERPNSGPARLAMAKVDAAAGRVEEAVLQYRRAILGLWPRQASENRAQARMELVVYLNKQRRLLQARSELLAMIDGLPEDPAVQKQAGHMLIQVGLAREAADLFQALLSTGPPDAAEYDGLGEAQFELADYQRARWAFQSALTIDPADQFAAQYAELCDKVLALDPTLRGIGARERYRRSLEILRSVVAEAATCPGAASGDGGGAVAAARAALARKKAPASFSDAAEENTALAAQIWNSGVKTCGQSAGGRSLDLVMANIARH